jgi:hypothetical protein
MSQGEVLLRIANALEEMNQRLASIDQSISKFNDYYSSINHVPQSIVLTQQNQGMCNEEEMFRVLAQVYLDEEQLKRVQNLQRKSSRRVSINLGAEMSSYFESKMPEYEVNAREGFLIFKRDGQNTALCKFYTDLGFLRGTNWYSHIQDVVKVARQDYGLSSDRVIFLIGSMVNGLDNNHVTHVLSKHISNAELVDSKNRSLLEDYLTSYIQSITHLPSPSDQIFLLGAGIHPNIAATELLKGRNINLSNYNWLTPSVTEMMKYIRSK